MKPIHNILFTFDKPWAVQATGQLFPNSSGVVVAFSNCQLSIVNRTSSTFHSKFSALYSKFSFSQGFLYAPFGEITTEFNATFGNDVLPKYSFNAKELDEETGMYYYEARYYKPPVFTSRDVMFEKYFFMSPYAYCANNPVKYVDPDGKKIRGFSIDEDGNVHINYDKASKDAVRIYEAMSKTETGQSQFKTMISSETKIKLFLVNKNIGNRHGYTRGIGMKGGQYKRAIIVISTVKIGDRFDNATEGEMINAIGSHESVHATDPEQIQKDLKEPGSWESERKPIEIEYTSRTEYKKGNNEGFKKSYEDPSDVKDPYGNKKPSFNLIKK